MFVVKFSTLKLWDYLKEILSDIYYSLKNG